MERLSDEEAAKLVANPPTCAGILKPGTPAARMFQDWQRARSSEAAKEAENAALREEVERLRGERDELHRRVYGTDSFNIGLEALCVGWEMKAREFEAKLAALSESKDGGR